MRIGGRRFMTEGMAWRAIPSVMVLSFDDIYDGRTVAYVEDIPPGCGYWGLLPLGAWIPRT